MRIVKAREILKIDFDKYRSISINGVLLRGLEVFAEESEEYISIMGVRDREPILSTLLAIGDQAEIREERGIIYIEKVATLEGQVQEQLSVEEVIKELNKRISKSISEII